MRITDEKTGKARNLFETEEFSADRKKHTAAFDCDHSQTEVRKLIVGGNGIQIRPQCLKCGSAVGNAIRKDSSPANLPPFDERLAPVFEAARAADYKNIVKKHLALQDRREASNQIEYHAYLASAVWAEKRRKVIERAGGICEGCRDQPAEIVHHLTYYHIYDEFLFELVALCRLCHDRIHDEQNDEEVSFESPCAACRYQFEDRDQPWCGKFNVSTKAAMADDGECGPQQHELEPLK